MLEIDLQSSAHTRSILLHGVYICINIYIYIYIYLCISLPVSHVSLDISDPFKRAISMRWHVRRTRRTQKTWGIVR